MNSPQQQSTAAVPSPSESQHSPVQAATSYSQLNGPAPSSQAQSMAGPIAYAQQSGKKRKRLQKACAACHKAKRRCDGGLPCSNCAFAGRTCLYTDANGNAVAPPPRNNVNAPVPETFHHPSPPQYIIQQPVGQHQHQHQHQHAQQVHPHSMNRQRASSNVSLVSNGSPQMNASGPLSPPDTASGSPWITSERRRDLLNIFFSDICHPCNAIIDELTFTRDLASDDVEPTLLLSILALSSKEESASSNRSQPGEEFAKMARRLLFEEDFNGNTLLDSPHVEVAQALAFLSIHELSLGRLSRASLYIGNALRIASALRLQEGFVPSSRNSSSSSSHSSNVKRATSIRTACLIIILEVLISVLAGQQPVSQVSDIEVLTSISLPDQLTCSFVRLTSSITLLSQVISAEKSSSRSSQMGGHIGINSKSHSARSEADGLLRSLQSTLPFEEVFNPRNRQLNAQELSLNDHGNQENRLKSWCWTLMHSTFFISQIILEKGTSNSSVENLIDLVGILSPGERNSLFFRLPLLVICRAFKPSEKSLKWLKESNQVWYSSGNDLESSLAILGLSNQGSGANGNSPINSPPISIRPLSSNSNATSPTLPPLVKSRSSSGNHHHLGYNQHQQYQGVGHSRSISSPFHNHQPQQQSQRKPSPPSLPFLKISQPSKNQDESSASGQSSSVNQQHQRLPSLSPRPSTVDSTSPTSESLPSLISSNESNSSTSSTSTSTSTSSSSNSNSNSTGGGANYSLSNQAPPSPFSTIPRSMMMNPSLQRGNSFTKRSNSISPPPYKANPNQANPTPNSGSSSFGSLLHPNSEKWSPLPPLISRGGKESNIRT